jgi:hypothetical protein
MTIPKTKKIIPSENKDSIGYITYDFENKTETYTSLKN